MMATTATAAMSTTLTPLTATIRAVLLPLSDLRSLRRGFSSSSSPRRPRAGALRLPERVPEAAGRVATFSSSSSFFGRRAGAARKISSHFLQRIFLPRCSSLSVNEVWQPGQTDWKDMARSPTQKVLSEEKSNEMVNTAAGAFKEKRQRSAGAVTRPAFLEDTSDNLVQWRVLHAHVE